MPSYPVKAVNKNRIHGFDFQNKVSNGPLATLCGFNSDLVRTESRGMNCPKCWEEWKRRKAGAPTPEVAEPMIVYGPIDPLTMMTAKEVMEMVAWAKTIVESGEVVSDSDCRAWVAERQAN